VKHEVKALDIIWQQPRFDGRFTAENTIHIDDLSRNGALNPQSLLKIQAFKDARVSSATDRELYSLMRYLSLIAVGETDFTKLDHKAWKIYCELNASRVIAEDDEPGPSNENGESSID
jgi:ubiquitin-like domain-containing CTD phosphatase 1